VKYNITSVSDWKGYIPEQVQSNHYEQAKVFHSDLASTNDAGEKALVLLYNIIITDTLNSL